MHFKANSICSSHPFSEYCARAATPCYSYTTSRAAAAAAERINTPDYKLRQREGKKERKNVLKRKNRWRRRLAGEIFKRSVQWQGGADKESTGQETRFREAYGDIHGN